MVVVFKPKKVRKSFYSDKVTWVSGYNMDTRKYIKGLVTKNKLPFIKVLKQAKDQNKSVVVSLNIVKHKTVPGKTITFINPGTQTIEDI